MNNSSSINKLHISYLDGLRACAAIYVVLHHAAIHYPQITLESGATSYFFKIFFRGHLAVDLFIVLSGYCLMMPLLNNGYSFKKGAFNFLKRRTIRILPPYFLAVGVSVILIYALIDKKTGTHWDISVPVNALQDIGSHLLLIQDIFTSTVYKINHSLWSISVEYRICLLFPFILYLWRKFGGRITILSTVIFSYLLYLLSESSLGSSLGVATDVSGVNPYIILFALGMFGADISYAAVNGKKVWKPKFGWGSLLILSVVVFLIGWRYKGYYSPHILDVIFGITCCMLLIYLAHAADGKKKNWIVSFLSIKPLVFMGSFAYSIYLIHAPLVQVMSQYILAPMGFSVHTNALLLMFIGTPVMILLSYLFFLACELPFLTKSKAVKDIEEQAVVNPAP